MGFTSFVQGCFNVLVSLSGACRDVTYHLFDFGGDIFNLAAALFHILNKIGLLLLNIGKYILVLVYQIVYVTLYTCWIILAECASCLQWLCLNCLSYGNVAAGFMLNLVAETWSCCYPMLYSLYSWIPTLASWMVNSLLHLGGSIWYYAALLLQLVQSAGSAICSHTWVGLVNLWHQAFCPLFLMMWLYICSIKEKCHGILAHMCDSLTAPFHIEALKLHLYQVTQDLTDILSSDWYRTGFLCILSSICVCLATKKLYTYLYRKGFTFPVYGLSHGNVIHLPANNQLDYIDLSDDEEPAFLRNLQVRNVDYYRANNHEVDTESDSDLSDISQNSEVDSIDGSENSLSTVTGSDSDLSDEDTDSDDFFDDDASDITEVENNDNEPINIQLPDSPSRYEFRSRSYTPSRMTPFQLKKELQSEQDRRKCVICTENEKDVLLLPCRHMCMCVDCAHQLVSQRAAARRICPLCRSRIESVMNIYL